MEAHESYFYQKWCVENNILIYPIPITKNGSRCKIAINTNGREKLGAEVYEDKPTTKELEVRVQGGVKKVKVVIPGLYDKIRELHKEVYLKNKDR